MTDHHSFNEFEENCAKFQEFIRQKPLLASAALKLTEEISVLAKIADNPYLFFMYIHSDGIHTTNLVKTLYRLTPDEILICINDIECYGIYTQDQYRQFCHN